ncbi:hypothetical protein BJ138DRAFT_1160132 [Hygrophoropsis aurantiaca]|uniref:Uncharacterized protein n=1 Tax=Hygrophoropsis aurantiaca TaxID=72124 RepID=A0ACB8A340_9AGAM|nr:hypothetical protein BJ138DRAFT_1160132 [Hygrophoropsis aurantiaca]
MSAADELAVLIQAGYELQLVKYLGALSATVLIYDYLLTSELEVKYVWKYPWSAVKILYLATRYTPFIDTTVMVLYRDLLWGTSPETCHIAIGAVTWMYVIGMAVAETLLVIRTWAVWGRSRKVAIFLIVHAVVTLSVVCYSTSVYVDSLVFSYMPLFSGCFGIQASKISYVNWSLFMVAESVYLGMMLGKAYPLYKQGRDLSGLYRMLLKDGIAFYIVLFTLSAINLVVVLTQAGILSTILSTPIRVIHAILATRMVYHIRETATRSSRAGDAYTMNTLRSMKFVAGNKPQSATYALASRSSDGTDEV